MVIREAFAYPEHSAVAFFKYELELDEETLRAKRRMKTSLVPQFEKLPDNAVVAIVGGGPAGSFTAIHLLNRAKQQGRQLEVFIFERRCHESAPDSEIRSTNYSGCPKCAGGVSPRLNDALEALGIVLPPEVIQAQINSITIQGRWKHIRMEAPDTRKMFSVYRGTLPYDRQLQHEAFDALLLNAALAKGAKLIGSSVTGASYDSRQKPVLHYQVDNEEYQLTADFAVFAGGVKELTDEKVPHYDCSALFKHLQPDYQPPPVRKALIFELEAPDRPDEACAGNLHFIACSYDNLQIDMCSIIPKKNYFTVSLIGKSVDCCHTHKQNLELVRAFIALPQIRRTLPPNTQFNIRCLCNPSIVVGSAVMPYGHRIAAVGDMATSRQYKDGILSGHDMARELATTILDRGVDISSLQLGYGPILRWFKRDNRYGSIIFFLYRWFFTNSFLSRIIYQTYSTEQKRTIKSRRSFERIFWAISSGDESYRKIVWWGLKPKTLWKLTAYGLLPTLRAGFAEYFFGLKWKGLGRFPVAVPKEALEAKRRTLLQDQRHEMEYMYSIDIRSPSSTVVSLLGEFGEEQRSFLNPKWVSIRRDSGQPLQSGCVINYRLFGGLISFSIEQLNTDNSNLIMYRVCGGFAHNGSFLFEVEPVSNGSCRLTVYLAYDYPHGDNLLGLIFWRTFRLLFPDNIHEVLWNHALCELKQHAESINLKAEANLIDAVQL